MNNGWGLIIAGIIILFLSFIVWAYDQPKIDLFSSGFAQLALLNEENRNQFMTLQTEVFFAKIGMFAGIILTIPGIILLLKKKPISNNNVKPISQGTKRTIAIGIGIAGVIVIGVVAYQVSLQPNIEVSNFNVSTFPNNQFVKVLDHGRVSISGDFDYLSPKDASYNLVFSNDFSIISTKYVSVSYTDKEQYYSQTIEVPPGAYKSIEVYAYSGQSVTGRFNVVGGSGNDIDFSVNTESCSQKVSFSFSLANYGPVSGNAQVSFNSDGSSVWSNNYYVETQKQISESGSVEISDCYQHDYKMVVSSQKRVG